MRDNRKRMVAGPGVCKHDQYGDGYCNVGDRWRTEGDRGAALRWVISLVYLKIVVADTCLALLTCSLRWHVSLTQRRLDPVERTAVSILLWYPEVACEERYDNSLILDVVASPHLFAGFSSRILTHFRRPTRVGVIM